MIGFRVGVTVHRVQGCKCETPTTFNYATLLKLVQDSQESLHVLLNRLRHNFDMFKTRDTASDPR